jgi:hypothetical protein
MISRGFAAWNNGLQEVVLGFLNERHEIGIPTRGDDQHPLLRVSR